MSYFIPKHPASNRWIDFCFEQYSKLNPDFEILYFTIINNFAKNHLGKMRGGLGLVKDDVI